MVAGERLSATVTRVLAPNPSLMTLSGTNTYLVGEDELVVIDPGPDLPKHLEAIVAAAARLGRVALSCVTHHHADHLPAAVKLRERLGVPIAGHRDLPHVDRPLGDEQLVELTGAQLRAIATPGHTVDHLCYLLESERALFTGDLIAGSGTVIVGDGRGELAQYIASLRRVAELLPRVILPGHGPVVEDAAAKIGEYLEHRLGREGQIVGLLERGPRTVREIVGELYAEVPSGLHEMAARNVRAHLWKLEDERRAQATGDRWYLVGGGETA